MLKKLKDFTNQLTTYHPRKEIDFAVKQLKRYGDKEGIDFIIRERGKGEYAVFTNTEGYNEVKITGVFRK
jgi:hypothetical protein